ncbi:hypothetical protein JTB14_038258 [Gonioctena quinquepunctata]|nr:hypothetical protein JTB14_038258 [Gonioctena quinquepunctata]
MRDTLPCIKSLSKTTQEPVDIRAFKTYKKYYLKEFKVPKENANNISITNSSNKSRDRCRLMNFERNENKTKERQRYSKSPEEFNDLFCDIAENILHSLPIKDQNTTNFLENLPNPKASFFLLPATEMEV